MTRRWFGLRSLPGARLAKALGGQKAGNGWMASCPAHADRKPSLSIRDSDDGKVLVHCHAGCSQEHVLKALQSRGLWKPIDTPGTSRAKAVPSSSNRSGSEDAARTAAALAIWRTGLPATDTAVEAYLGSRALHQPVPETLRFHPALRHPAGGTWPAMVALVTRGPDHAPMAIHRTFLARDRAGKAPVKPPRMMLGPCRGGAVRLAVPGTVLMVGEGIETCLAAMQSTGYPAWAALSTSGLRTLDLPAYVRHVIVLADGDEPGEAAARDCAWRWMREGRRVEIARPPRGLDFNDVLMGCASPARGGVK